MKLKFIGKMYRGQDPVSGISLNATTGMIVDVSDQKADQLLKDYPKDWTKEETRKAEPTPKVEEIGKQEIIQTPDGPIKPKDVKKKKPAPKKKAHK